MFISIKVLSLVVLLVVSAVAQSDSDLKEAQRHYKIALVALDKNDLDIASEELNKAVALAPSNALGRYYLARIQSQQGKSKDGLVSVEKAIALGLPDKEKELAEDLLAKLTYDAKRAESLRPLWLNGKWSYSGRNKKGSNGYCKKEITRTWTLFLSEGTDGPTGKLYYKNDTTYPDYRCRADDFNFTRTFRVTKAVTMSNE